MLCFLVCSEQVTLSHVSLHQACAAAHELSCHGGTYTVVQRLAGLDLEVASYESGEERILEGKELADTLAMELGI